MLPKQCDVVIFDREGCHEIIEYILKNRTDYTIVDSYIKHYYLHPFFLFLYIKNLITSIDYNYGILSTIYRVYFATLIQIIKPKVVITYIDDNTLYHWLIKRCEGPTYIAIQNGIRQKFHKKLVNREYSHDHYYCFGQYDIIKHSELGHKIKYGHPIGSLRSGIFYEKTKEQSNEIYDICLISNWINKKKCQQNKLLDEINDYSHKVNTNLARFIKTNIKKISIALRTSTDEEYNYYREIFGNNAFIFKYNHQPYSSYNLMLQSKLTVSFMSTSVLEALSLNKKAIFIDTSMSDDYVDYDDAIRYKFTSYNPFEEKLNTILEYAYKDYIKPLNAIKENVINLDLNNLPQNIISSHLIQILKEKNEPRYIKKNN